MEGKTSTGFQFRLAEDAGDDMELLEDLILLDKGDLTALSSVLTALLGEEQKRALYEHCRNERGRVPTTAVIDEMHEILLAANGSVKN